MIRLFIFYLIFNLLIFSQGTSEDILGSYQLTKAIGTIEIFMSYTFFTNNLVVWEYYSKTLRRESSFQLKGTYQIINNYIKVSFLQGQKSIKDKFEIVNEELLKGSDGLFFERYKDILKGIE